ncbi:MAG: hypothetical protein MZU95_16220 [Desulfomicrobium escambiense]|nr:hypothetical protein [Desulfomicrobium escambiense]
MRHQYAGFGAVETSLVCWWRSRRCYARLEQTIDRFGLAGDTARQADALLAGGVVGDRQQARTPWPAWGCCSVSMAGHAPMRRCSADGQAAGRSRRPSRNLRRLAGRASPSRRPDACRDRGWARGAGHRFGDSADGAWRAAGLQDPRAGGR